MSGRASRVTVIAAGFALQAGLMGAIAGLTSGSHPGAVFAHPSPPPAVRTVPFIQPLPSSEPGIVTVTMSIGKQAGVARIPVVGADPPAPPNHAVFRFRPSTALTLVADVTIPSGVGVQGFSVTAVPGTWDSVNPNLESGYGMFDATYPLAGGQRDLEVVWADPAYGPMASGMLQAYGPNWMLVLTVQRPGATFGYPIAQLHFG